MPDTPAYAPRLQEFRLSLAAGSRQTINIDGSTLAYRDGPQAGIRIELQGRSVEMLPGMSLDFGAPFGTVIVINDSPADAEVILIAGAGGINIPAATQAVVSVLPPTEIQASSPIGLNPGQAVQVDENTILTASRIISVELYNNGNRGVFVQTTRAGINAENRAFLAPGERLRLTSFPRNASATEEKIFWLVNPRSHMIGFEVQFALVDITVTGTLES